MIGPLRILAGSAVAAFATPLAFQEEQRRTLRRLQRKKWEGQIYPLVKNVILASD
jgi:hypothetical protein